MQYVTFNYGLCHMMCDEEWDFTTFSVKRFVDDEWLQSKRALLTINAAISRPFMPINFFIQL